jgi:hypothetical protein
MHIRNASDHGAQAPPPRTEPASLFAILKLGARLTFSPEASAELRQLLRRGVDWPALETAALQEGVALLLFETLRRLSSPMDIPAEFTAVMEDLRQATTRANLAAVAAALELSNLAERAGVRIMALQGLTVLRLYHDPALRPMNDLDVMVRPAHRAIFAAVLLREGYELVDPRYPDLFRGRGIEVDLHTHILNLDRIRRRDSLFAENLCSMWDEAEPFHQSGDALLRPSLEDNFIALAAHALKHGYSRLIWLTDLSVLLKSLEAKEGGWNRLLERTRFWGQTKSVLFAMVLVGEMLGERIPASCLQALGADRLMKLERRLLDGVEKGYRPPGLASVLSVCVAEGLGGKLRLAREVVWPRAEVMRRLPLRKRGRLTPADYLARLRRAVSEAWKVLQ